MRFMSVRRAIIIFGVMVVVFDLGIAAAAQQRLVSYGKATELNLIFCGLAGVMVARGSGWLPPVIAAAGVAAIDATLGWLLNAVMDFGFLRRNDPWYFMPLSVMGYAGLGAGCGIVG